MKHIIMAAMISGSVSGGVLFAEGLPGVPVFGDDFSAPGLFVEHWDATKGARSEGGRAILPAGNSITLRKVQEGDFAIIAEVTVDPPASNEFGHCGVIVDGIHFMIKPGTPPSAGTAYRLPGEERSRGNAIKAIPGFEYGKPCRITVTREKVGPANKYACRINDEPVDTFPAAMPGIGKIGLYAYKCAMSVTQVQLFALKAGDGSNNLAVNSSFEHLQEGMAPYMRPLPGGKLLFEGKWEDFIASFAIDTREKVSGRQSARMTVGKDYPKSNGVATHNVNVMAKTPVTFSVYLKASESNFPATLGLWELHAKNHYKPVVLSQKWERYSFTVTNPALATVRASVSFSQTGTVWADDLQVEIGSEPTPYKPSPLDADKFPVSKKGKAPKPVIAKDVAIESLKAAPVIDGVLEEAWFREAAKVQPFLLEGKPDLPNRTEAYIACDGDSLYLAVRAHVADPARVKGTPGKRDDLSIHGEDCIEVLLDSTFGRRRYYHFTVNAAGSTTDMGPGRVLAWNGKWEAAARINEAEKSIDYEIRLPLALFAGLDLSDQWGLNIGRHDTENQKVYSLVHTKEANFHLPALFPAVVFPKNIIGNYRIGLKELHLVPAPGAGAALAGTVENRSGKPVDAELQVMDGSTGAVLGACAAMLAEGETRVTIPVPVSPDTKAVDGVLKIRTGGKERVVQSRRITQARPLEVYARHSYYMNESNAVFVGTLGLPDADTLKGRLAVAGKVFDIALGREWTAEIPLKDIGVGEHPVTVDVFRGAEKVGSASAVLVKREYRPGAVQIDRQRRCLVVDGKPYLAVMPFFGVERGIKPEQQEAVLRNMVRLHKDMGYRCFLVGAVDDNPVPGQTQAFVDLCAKEGIKVLYWPFQSWRNRDKITPERRFQTLKGDNIIGWMVVDEPELYAKSEEVEPFMEAHRKANPYTPVFMNNTLIGIPGRFAGLKTDILMLDDYLCNRENRKVAEMYQATQMMMEAGQEDRKPVYYFLEGENLHNHYRECTYAEQVAETYAVIIAGGSGVSYFCSLPLYPEDYRACVDVNRELLELEDALFSLEKTSAAAADHPGVVLLTRRLNGRIVVIALNLDQEREAEATITLPPEFSYAPRAEVKFEDRRVKVRKGTLTDTFQPLERHVYVAELKEGAK